MPSLDLLAAFFLASSLFALTPGPSMLYAAARTAAEGRRVGRWSALGFHLAGLLHTAAAAFGVSALLAASPALFTGLKLAGAAYMMWLGVRALSAACASHAPPAPGASDTAVPTPPPPPTPDRALRDSLLVEATNPKSALFFFAFLPQFADAGAGLPVWTQILILGAGVNLLFSATDILAIEAAHRLARAFRRSRRAVRALRAAGGTALIALGAALAAQERG